MNLSVYDWIYQIVVEGIKYILIAHYFLGFEFSRGKKRGLLLLYPLGIPIVEYWDNLYIVYSYYYAWGGILLIVLFGGRMREKIKAFFVIWFLIALVDALVLMMFVMLPNIFFANQSGKRAIILGCVSAVFWGFMSMKGRNVQQCTKNFWKKLSNLEYILSLSVLVLGSLFVGGMQGNLDETTTTKVTAFRLGILVMISLSIALVLLLHTGQSKRRLEEVNQLNIRYLELQKKYYEDSLKQYEDMRSFRHDINHHLYVLSELSRSNKVLELKEYIGTMTESYDKMRGVHTGNFIADCIISQILCKLQEKEKFHFDLEGHFPKDFFLEDIDFCILLSNLLENAKEALEKIDEESFLQIEVKHFQQWFYLTIRNSAISEEIDFQVTSKLDKRNHGYGMQNISRIVEKYNGTVVWNYENEVVEVKIKFNQNKL